LLKEVQKAGTGNSTTAKTIRDAFGDYFDPKTGKPLALETKNVSYNGSSLSTTFTPNKSIIETFQSDLAAVEKLATSITGGVTLAKLRADLLVALGNAKPTTPKGTVIVNPKATVQTAGGKDAYEAAKKARASGQSQMVSVNDVVWYRFGYNGKDYISNDAGTEVYNWDASKNVKGSKVKVKAASGGYISGPGSPTSDSIPAMLSNGEYVISAKAVQAAGVPMLDNINKMASGGMVSYNVPKMSSGGRVKFSEGGLASSSSSLYNINVSLSGTNLTADDVAASIHKEMKLREMAAGVNRKVGRP
jgi:hypothetical protein